MDKEITIPGTSIKLPMVAVAIVAAVIIGAVVFLTKKSGSGSGSAAVTGPLYVPVGGGSSGGGGSGGGSTGPTTGGTTAPATPTATTGATIPATSTGTAPTASAPIPTVQSPSSPIPTTGGVSSPIPGTTATKADPSPAVGASIEQYAVRTTSGGNSYIVELGSGKQYGGDAAHKGGLFGLPADLLRKVGITDAGALAYYEAT